VSRDDILLVNRAVNSSSFKLEKCIDLINRCVFCLLMRDLKKAYLKVIAAMTRQTGVRW
jgi:hypothetical protein